MEQKRNRPIRINILNKELWEKEEKLIKRWKVICYIWVVYTLIVFVSIYPYCEFWVNPPKYMGYIFLVLYFIACFGGLFCTAQYIWHKQKFYDLKFGKKWKNNK